MANQIKKLVLENAHEALESNEQSISQIDLNTITTLIDCVDTAIYPHQINQALQAAHSISKPLLLNVHTRLNLNEEPENELDLNIKIIINHVNQTNYPHKQVAI